MKIVKMSRRLEKMPHYFRNFIKRHDLWPNLNTQNMPGFSISSIQDDVRGYTIKKWQSIVNTHLVEHGAKLEYIRATGKQHFIFQNDSDFTMFVLRWG